MKPKSNVHTEKYTSGKVLESPSKDQQKSADPTSTKRGEGGKHGRDK